MRIHTGPFWTISNAATTKKAVRSKLDAVLLPHQALGIIVLLKEKGSLGDVLVCFHFSLWYDLLSLLDHLLQNGWLCRPFFFSSAVFVLLFILSCVALVFFCCCKICCLFKWYLYFVRSWWILILTSRMLTVLFRFGVIFKFGMCSVYPLTWAVNTKIGQKPCEHIPFDTFFY